MRASHRGSGVVGLRDGYLAEASEALEFRLGRLIAGGAREANLHSEEERRLSEGPSDVVVVTHPRDGATGQLAELAPHRESVSERLHRMGAVGEQVDHRGHPGVAHTNEVAVVEHSRRDDPVVAGKHPDHILHGLPGVESHLLATGVHRVTTELHDGHLHRVTGSIRRFLEHERDALALEGTSERGDRRLRQV